MSDCNYALKIRPQPPFNKVVDLSNEMRNKPYSGSYLSHSSPSYTAHIDFTVLRSAAGQCWLNSPKAPGVQLAGSSLSLDQDLGRKIDRKHVT